MDYGISEVFMINGWPPGCYSQLQYEWTMYFNQLQLQPIPALMPLSIRGEGSFDVHLMLNGWGCFAFVAEPGEDYCPEPDEEPDSRPIVQTLNICIAQAEQFIKVVPTEALVLSGSPKDGNARIRLFSVKLSKRVDGQLPKDRLWSIVNVIDPGKQIPSGWHLQSGSEIYTMDDGIVHQICSCAHYQCKACKITFRNAPPFMDPKLPESAQGQTSWVHSENISLGIESP